MFAHRCLQVAVLGGSLFIASAAVLTAATLEGHVKAPDGKPIRDAEVEIARSNTRTALQKVKTDQKGGYVFKNLSEGVSYKLTVWANKVPTTIENVQTAEQTPVRIDLNLMPGGVKIQAWVYMREETGSHLGAQWLAMDKYGNVAPGVNPVYRASGEVIREVQSHIGW